MAGGLDQTRATEIMTALAKNSGTATLGTQTITGPHSLRIMTANGTDTSAGTEASTASGYTAGGVAMTLGTPSAGAFSNSAQVGWTNMPGITSTGAEQWDASGTKLRIFWAPWSGGNIAIGAGNSFAVAIAGWNPSMV